MKLLKKINYPMFTIVVGLVTLILAFLCNGFFKDWKFINSDGMGYYVYLPAIVVDHDTSLNSAVIKIANTQNADPYAQKEYFGMRPQTDNFWIDKYPIGVALVQAPFFLGADLLTQITGGVRDGFSSNYQWAIAIAGLLFLQIGMYFAYKVLRKRFGNGLALILLSFLILGTNIMHYAVYEPSMSHIYSFAFITLTVFLLDKYLENKKFKWIVSMGITMSIIGVIRNLNLLFGIIPLLVILLNTAKGKRPILLIKTLVVWGLTAFVIFIPQLLYWYFSTGKFLAYSYAGETFNLFKPELLKLLFSVNNGLFFWHPLLLLAIPGLYFWIKSHDAISKVSTIFLLLLTYILSSWWCWWFGYSFGMRPFTDFYILFLIPIGYLFLRMKKWKRRYIVLSVVIISMFFILNLIQMNNYWRGIVAGANISWENYWINFANPHLVELLKRF